MKIHTANSMKIERLYHYQPYDAERLARIVIDRELYFSKPVDFNDPWDCRVSFNSKPVSDPAFREKHALWYAEVTRKHMPEVPDHHIERTANEIRNNPDWLKGKIEECSTGIEKEMENRYRVYCLGSKPDCELMWAHYACKHSGICMEFNVRRNEFASALKVEYLSDYPVIDLTDEREAMNLLPLLSKSAAWSYEQEYRLIAQERKAVIAEGTLIADDGRVTLPEGALAAIIIGCMASQGTVEAVAEIIARSGLPLMLKRAVRERDRYHLSIEPVG